MKLHYLLASAVLVAAIGSVGVSAPAQAKTMKECAAEWQQLKADKKTNGMKYRDFSKQCMAGGDTSASPPPAPPPPAGTPPATTTKPTGGREAMYARERACAAEWKELKAQNKRPPGMKWPQFWSECDKRKKAEGM
jgi:hypothetical protein